MIGGFESSAVFRQSLERRLEGVNRGRRRLATERLAVRLQARRPSGFLVKGGFALELRLKGKFRPTSGLDIAAEPGPGAEIEAIAAEVEAACDVDVSDGFEFHLEGRPEVRDLEESPARTLRCRIAGQIDGRLFETVPLAVRTRETDPGGFDDLEGSHLLDFAGIRPPRIRVLPLEDHFAEKVHAYTRPGARPHERVRDLVDMYALIELGTSGGSVTKDTLRRVYWHRKAEEIPAFLVMPPEEWRNGFSLLARSVAGVPEDMTIAFEKIAAFYAGLWR